MIEQALEYFSRFNEMTINSIKRWLKIANDNVIISQLITYCIYAFLIFLIIFTIIKLISWLTDN